ncbi:MAG: DUF2800 domain-containing protein [Lachnospiraceae bacterium]
MIDHKERAHALLSASGAHRWLTCTPSAILEEGFPDTSSTAAAEGTLAHELCELKLRKYFYSADLSKQKYTREVNKLKKHELWDNEMEEYTEVYLDYIKGIALKFPTSPYVVIEQRMDFSSYVPSGFGTADCILLSGNTLQVIDFKYGRSPDGRVDAENNPQMMLYALGAYVTYMMLYRIENIRLSIIQPRLLDGITEWQCGVSDLLAFGEYVKERAELAIKGEGEYAPGVKTCRYCRARSKCRARAEENVKLAFAVDKIPPLITNEEMGKFLKQGEDVAKWLKDLQEIALSDCLAGRVVPGWKAVEGRGSRDWTDMDKAFETLLKSGMAEESILYERKPLTLAQVEKVIGKKDFNDSVGDFVSKNPGKPALVQESDKRPAITNKVSAEEAFADNDTN